MKEVEIKMQFLTRLKDSVLPSLTEYNVDRVYDAVKQDIQTCEEMIKFEVSAIQPKP